jgi:hypothetical protein
LLAAVALEQAEVGAAAAEAVLVLKLRESLL